VPPTARPAPGLCVVVPVHNGEATLRRCLDALVAECGPDVEIIVVDDASTDTSASIAEAIGVVVLTLPKNVGASAARKHGIGATTAPVVVLVDADVVVRPGAIRSLLDALEAPDIIGVNGIFDLDISTAGLVTAFTNTSLHYQHLRHGDRVSSTFTSLCAVRREAFLARGSWEERTSRFADDVGTRWRLPPRSIALAVRAQCEHLKAVRLGGLLRHRYQVGWHFIRSLQNNSETARRRPEAVLLAWRYPANSVVAALSVVLLPLGPATPLVSGALFAIVNLDFALFTLRVRGPLEALLAIPISALEGYAYTAGMSASTVDLLRRKLAAAPAPAR
jgi:glycosyltransferase involved in cell wall biosynthesis